MAVLRATIATLALAVCASSTDTVCVDHTANGFYTAESSTFTTGPPGNGVVGRPTTISPCELEQLSRDCVARINDYRTGKIGFSNGAANPTLPDLKPLFEQTNGHQCSNRQAVGDLFENVMLEEDACDGAHATFEKCPAGGNIAQNTCCGRGGGVDGPTHSLSFLTYNSAKEELFSCLQSMWDEGTDEEAVEAGDDGNYMRMKSEQYIYASCGFAWTESGRILMNQDFDDAVPAEYAGSECKCEGKMVGDDNGCPLNFGAGACVGNETNSSSSSTTATTVASTTTEFGKRGWIVAEATRTRGGNVPLVAEVSAAKVVGETIYITKANVTYFVVGVLASLVVMLPIAAFLLRRTGRKFSHPW